MSRRHSLQDEHGTLTEVARILRSRQPTVQCDGNDLKLDMRTFTGSCGTTACIAGMCVIVENPDIGLEEAESKGAAIATNLVHNTALKGLFYANDEYGVSHMADLEVRRDPLLAAEAIDNYLAGVKTPWQPILERLKVI